MHDHRRGVRSTLFAEPAEPTPAAVAELHLGEPIDTCLDDLRQARHRQRPDCDQTFPARGTLTVVADFLGIEVRPFRLDRRQINVHPPQSLLRDDRRQESIEGLLGAAVGIVDQVGQGIDHRPGQASACSGFPAESASARRSLGTVTVNCTGRFVADESPPCKTRS